MLITAGANLEKRYQSATPLQLAMGGGHLEVMRAMVKAGVNVDRRHHSGATALSAAASDGQLDIVEVLLGANANPLLTTPNSLPGGPPLVALDAAARGGHAVVVRRMIGHLGIEGCGGATNQRMDVMAILVDVGVVDNGYALVGAAACGAEASVKFLLQQHDKKKHASASSGAYVNSICHISGSSPLHYGMGFGEFYSARIVRMLVDAGADTTSRVRLRSSLG
ncbi:EsV-1-1 [Ectocarpus siliculosus]|uniref:EsV-1-1 n=1 Tax=Ectocarpus siliculosus TaxID=2880 RepID=D7FXF2_ECTSI|nr:EsV-1-1 [Ectocarpus siliculosus]|eukprot:CBJ32289.1 EsV-1-1 [Ectocarpus siliculosus]